MERGIEPDELAIGQRLRAARDAAGISLRTLASTSGVAVSHLSGIERGNANVTLTVLKRICDALGIRVGELLHEPEDHTDSVRILRGGDRKRVLFPQSGIVNELLSPNMQGMMEIIWVEAERGSTSGDHPHQHEGEEFGLIFQGAMEFTAGGEVNVLEAGDSVYLKSTVPHSWQSVGDEVLRALWVITPPTF
jgi:transcriptional regulator with XRE-family HTH domain